MSRFRLSKNVRIVSCALGLFSTLAIAATPVSPNASPEAKAVLDYLYAQFGKKTLSGQMYAPWAALDETELVHNATGKYPAIRGQDLITESANNKEIQQAIAWWKAGGIPTVMWHWGAPSIGEGYDNSKKTIDIAKCFQTGTPEYTAMWADLKRIADHLQALRDANVPVLWRPMHENDGGWFWYGKGSNGADAAKYFVKLWQTMFTYFTVDRKLNNLIWVMCHSGSPKPAWNPGTAYVDLAGGDTYASSNDPQLGIFNSVKSIYGAAMPKPLHECGILPDPDKAFQQGATWSWWMLWHTSYAENHDKAEMKRIYNHDLVITRDELPDLKKTASISLLPETVKHPGFAIFHGAAGLEVVAGKGAAGIELVQPATGRILARADGNRLVLDADRLPNGVVAVRTRSAEGWSPALSIVP